MKSLLEVLKKDGNFQLYFGYSGIEKLFLKKEFVKIYEESFGKVFEFFGCLVGEGQLLIKEIYLFIKIEDSIMKLVEVGVSRGRVIECGYFSIMDFMEMIKIVEMFIFDVLLIVVIV